MRQEAQPGFLGIHSASVVYYLYEGPAIVADNQHDGCGSGIGGILHEFLYNGGRPLDNLPGGNETVYVFRKNFKHNSILLVHLISLEQQVQGLGKIEQSHQAYRNQGIYHEPLALSILHKNGVESIPAGREAATKKINSIGDSWFMFIENHALESMTEEQRQFIRDNIDMEKYLDLLEDCFEQNWRNILPEKKAKNVTPASPLEDSSAASDFQQMRMDM